MAARGDGMWNENVRSAITGDCLSAIGGEIIVGEDKNAVPSERYLCCYVERNELMDFIHGLASGGYAEIFEIYGQRITGGQDAIENR